MTRNAINAAGAPADVDVAAGLRAEFVRLSAPNVLGNFQCFEVTEVVYYSAADPKTARTVFSIYVAETLGIPSGGESPAFLNTTRLTVPGLKGLTFGVVRRYVTSAELQATCAEFDAGGGWVSGSAPPNVGPLHFNPAAFVPPDASEAVRINGLLKNNFDIGSHVIELSDQTKAGFEFLLDPDVLGRLSSLIEPYVPLKIGRLPDRLGNVFIQFPVSSISVVFGGIRASNTLTIELAWHPQIAPRPLIGTFEVSFDGVISTYGSARLTEGSNEVAFDRTNRGFRAFVWDEQSKLLLAASAPLKFINRMGMSSSTMPRKARAFRDYSADPAGGLREVGITYTNRHSEFGQNADCRLVPLAPLRQQCCTEAVLLDEDR